MRIIDSTPLVKQIAKTWRFIRMTRKSLARFQTLKDPDDTARTTPPTADDLQLHCVWITEIYTPSTISTFCRCLEKLGWDKAVDDFGADMDLTEWIERSRSDANSYYQSKLWAVFSPSHKDGLRRSGNKFALLPSGVDRAMVTLQTITSSLTLLTIQFILTDNVAASINAPFRSSYKSRLRYCPSWLNVASAVYVDIEMQKRKAIKQKLNEIHADLYTWFRWNFAGHFSNENRHFPTVDLITSKQYNVAESRLERRNHHTELLFDKGVDKWISKEDSKLELRFPTLRTGDFPLTLFGNFSDLTEGAHQYGGKNGLGISNKLNMAIGVTIGLYAIHKLLVSLEEELVSIRDTATLPLKNTKHAIKNLTYARQQFSSTSRDVQAICDGVTTVIKEKVRYASDCMDFAAAPEYRSVYDDLLELMRQQDEMRLRTLSRLEAQVSAAINGNSNLTSAIASLRIQRTVFWLTWGTLLLTAVSLFSKGGA